MNIDIEQITEKLGKEIADSIIEKYGDDLMIDHKSLFKNILDSILSGGYSRVKVEKEIYERSLHEATKFFLNNSAMKFNDKVIDILKFHLQSRLQNKKDIKKLNPEEMLANVIKSKTLDSLLERDGVVI